ncbi:hypothetical protein [Halocalculus aciditolerans]|uniref:Uncharacterized protein n=1 Tax=Halocalculus aciditolerans TaxID=1383812 RepID=A0A830FG42_9EURY|nr:hypothetical protein [Halocalculus aciditolerans]GGL51726.1 hypothetical protein GCM10009039_07550 [Halocalculus aciditolerans]
MDSQDGVTADESGGEPSDTMRERVSMSNWAFWLLLDADRRVVAASMLAAVFAAVVGAGVLHPTGAYTLLTRGDPMETLYQALVGSTITGVTLVLTLSQLVLSQEQGAVGDQRERMQAAMAFRRDVEDVIDEAVGPAEPSAFLRALVADTAEQAGTLADAASGLDGRARDRVETLSRAVKGNADAVGEQLDGATFGEFDVVWAALNYNYSWKLYAARRIRAENGDALNDAAVDALDDLVETLELFGPAREHFKTLYFQWELTELSRTILYAAVPALAVSIGSLMLFDPRGVTTATLGVSDALLVAAATVVVSLLPFALLLAYILRIVTVTQRTLSIGPFILRETDRSVDLDET